jgi:hypothetical protein
MYANVGLLEGTSRPHPCDLGLCGEPIPAVRSRLKELRRTTHSGHSHTPTEFLRTLARVEQAAEPVIHRSVRAPMTKSQFPNGIVSSVSFVSTTKTARSLAGSVSLALALTAWRSPGSSEKLCPAL